MVRKVTSTGMYSQIGYVPYIVNWENEEENYKDWYRSSETISGTFPFGAHLSNKKMATEKSIVKLIVKIIK